MNLTTASQFHERLTTHLSLYAENKEMTKELAKKEPAKQEPVKQEFKKVK